MSSVFTLRAPAKLNLTLEVLRVLPTGLHALRSVMVPITWYDEIEIAAHTDNPGFSTSNSELEEDNLIVRALNSLDVRLDAIRVHLKKNIPVGGGLGGGSSDAAGILIAASNGAFGNGTGKDYLALAQSLGSDVPFFLTQTGALVEGSGERVTALGNLPAWWSVIVHPPLHVPTFRAYADLDISRSGGRRSGARKDSVSLQTVSALQRADFAAVQHLLSNDFQAVMAQKYAPIGDALEALRRAGANKPVLTGCGSCAFALTQSQRETEEIRARLQLPAAFHTYSAAFDRSAVWVGNPAAT